MIHGGDIYTNDVYMDASVNINPLGPPDVIMQSLAGDSEWLLSYPQLGSENLKEDIASVFGCCAGELVIGNGASEIIMGLFHAILPKKTLVAAPGFYGYVHGAESIKSELVYYCLTAGNNFCITEDFLNAVTEDIDLVILTNPNNPTGQVIDEGVLERILFRAKECHAFVMIDECFRDLCEFETDFASEGRRIGRLLDRYDHLLILRAFTKTYAMPGLRLGYALGNAKLIQQIIPHLPEWNVSAAAQRAADELLSKEYRQKLLAYRRKTTQCIRREREFLQEEIERIGKTYHAAGLVLYAGMANYMLLYCKIDLYSKMLNHGILIRDCSNYRGLSKGWFRIAVADHEKNKKLVHVLEQVVREYEDTETEKK